MIVVPAIDLRDGRCVQLRGGDFDHELVRLDDPEGVAAWWRDLGFSRLHVVDLDAATGRGDNASIAAAICRLEGVDVQVGGGVRNDEDVRRLLDAGASAVLVGTRAVDEPGWLASLAAAHPGTVALALDVRAGVVTTEGWRRQTTRRAADVLAEAADLELDQVVLTAVDVEGIAKGPDLELVAEVRAATGHRLGVAGGVATNDDLLALDELGVDAVVVGTALYTGALDPEGLSEELHR